MTLRSPTAVNFFGAMLSTRSDTEELFLIQHAVVVDPDASAAEREAGWRGHGRSCVRGGQDARTRTSPTLTSKTGRAHYGTNYERLVRIKRKCDPDDFFRFPQSISSRDLGSGPTGVKSCV